MSKKIYSKSAYFLDIPYCYEFEDIDGHGNFTVGRYIIFYSSCEIDFDVFLQLRNYIEKYITLIYIIPFLFRMLNTGGRKNVLECFLSFVFATY